MPRRFPPPWTAQRIPGGYVVKDATGQALAYVYAREDRKIADTAKVLTMDESGVLPRTSPNCPSCWSDRR
jgi:hypothetical protein